jgi:uroporphyrin-3 C-methyltransferase
VVAVASLLALSLAWQSQQRIASLERELVRRQELSQGQVTLANAAAQQSQEQVREALAKLALLDARVSEVAVGRAQIEELIASVSRSRDENVLVDIDTGLRVAMQQSAITASAEPLVASLRQADERLARYKQPRLEGVRRAIARDLDRVRAVGAVDVSALAIRLDEVVRWSDDLVLASAPAAALAKLQKPAGRETAGRSEAAKAAKPSPAASGSQDWLDRGADWLAAWPQWLNAIWVETKNLVRVSRVDQPDAMLLAPEQAFFVRENLKLRLLNARLALLSRQFDTAQADLQTAQITLDRYFDRSSKRTQLAQEALRSVAAQARQVVLPRPGDTLAALNTLGAGR